MKPFAFCLPSGFPACGGCMDGNTFLVVDGRTNAIFRVDEEGKVLSSVETKEVYSALKEIREADRTVGFFANVKGEQRTIRLLNAFPTEIGCIIPRFGENDFSVGDFSAFAKEKDRSLLLVSSKEAAVFDFDGNKAKTVLTAERNQTFLHALVSGTVRVLHFARKEDEYISVMEFGAEFTGMIPKDIVLKEIVPVGVHDVYGLFVKQARYSYLLPVYEHGVFVLEDTADFGKVLQNILLSQAKR